MPQRPRQEGRELKRVRIDTRDLTRIVEHARAEVPAECCGILAGRPDMRVSRVFPMTNVRGSSEEFLMDPEEQFAVFDEIKADELEMLAIYHSHPNTAARPSEHDIRMAFYPECAYLIVSLAADEPVAKAFSIIDGQVREIPLET